MKRMEVMKKVGVLVIMSVFLLSGTLFAQESKNYITAKVGHLKPGDSDMDLIELDSTFNFGASYGHFFSDKFSVELGVEKYSLESEVSRSSGYVLIGTGELLYVKQTSEISVMAIPITAKYHFPLNNNINAYIGAGIGLYFNDVDSQKDLTGRNYNNRIYSISDSGNCFGFHATAGADYRLNSNFSIGTEVKWSMANQSIKMKELELVGNHVESRDSGDADIDVGGLNFSVVVKYIL